MTKTYVPNFLAVAFVAALTITVAGAAEVAANYETKVLTAEETQAIWKDLMDGNKRFVAGNTLQRDVVCARENLVSEQKPKVIVLACADSRVSPELVFDKGLGDLFVVRIAGNVADKDALGSMEYAVEHLHCSIIVVLGHEKCGAVAAAAADGQIESPNLRALIAKIAPALSNIKCKVTGDELSMIQVEANVHQSAVDILKNSELIRTALEESKIALVKAVYHLKSGEVVKLSK